MEGRVQQLGKQKGDFEKKNFKNSNQQRKSEKNSVGGRTTNQTLDYQLSECEVDFST